MRDVNEGEIVRALEAAGATVTRLNGSGVPDLLVGYQKRTKLLEVKRPLGPKGGRARGGATKPNQGGDGLLTEAQLKWLQGDGKRPGWQGEAPVIVTTPAEALAAIGAPVPPPPPRALADVLDDPPADPPAEPDTTWCCSGCELVYPGKDGLDLEAGVAPPLHWTDTGAVRPWPLCPGFGKPGRRLT